MVADAIATARAAGATGEIVVRGASAYGNSSVALACRRAGARFSLVVVKNSTVVKAIAAIPDHVWTPVHSPGAVTDPDTGQLISDAEVAEIPAFTAFASTCHPVTARLIVRRVRDQARPRARAEDVLCAARDGDSAVSIVGLCVGCDQSPADMLADLVQAVTAGTGSRRRHGRKPQNRQSPASPWWSLLAVSPRRGCSSSRRCPPSMRPPGVAGAKRVGPTIRPAGAERQTLGLMSGVAT